QSARAGRRRAARRAQGDARRPRPLPGARPVAPSCAASSRLRVLALAFLPSGGLSYRTMAKRNANLLIVHAAELLTCAGPREGIRGAALDRVQVVADGAVAIVDGRIDAVGTSETILSEYQAQTVIDAS